MKRTFDDLVNEFDLLNGWEERYLHVIELGRSISFDDSLKTEKNKVHGCNSNAWLHLEERNGKLFIKGDSDAVIIRGLIAILQTIFNGIDVTEVKKVNVVEKLERLGFGESLSPQRSNGLYSIVSIIQNGNNLS